jgi:hypothetical protein
MPRPISMLFSLIFFLTAVLLLPALASGTTYYMSPAGSTNGATCGSSSDPCQNFSDAIPQLNPGDTLILMDGTYQKDSTGTPTIICSGTGSNAQNGAANARITIKAQHERRALIKAVDWSAHPFWMRHCGYWNIEGVHVEGGDFRLGLANGHAVAIWDSHDIVFRRNLVRFNNRCRNGAIVSVARTRRSLFEENEIYSFHRNGMGSGSGNVYRRNYMNSRGATNPPCYQTPGSHLTTRGDGAYIQVNVHVVAAGTSCQAVARSPPMPAYEQRAPLITRDVGAHTPGGAGLQSRTRSQSGGIGGDGPAVAGAAATGLAHLVAPPVERSASGCG